MQSFRLYNVLVQIVNYLQERSSLQSVKTHTIYSKLVTTDSVIVDLGANSGQFVRGVKQIFNCRCYAVEPVPALYEQIESCAKTKKFNYAISSQEKPVQLYISSNAECHSIHESVAATYGILKTITVRGITLESLLREEKIKSIDLLKIDIEGSEKELFEATLDETLGNVKQITIEFHDFIDGSISRESVQDICKKLKK